MRTDSKAWGLAARPVAADPNSTYIDLSTGKQYVYEADGWKEFGHTAPDLSSYVKKTDYATADKAGVVKIGANVSVASGVISVANELPTVTSEDAGKIATVSAEGTWSAVDPTED